jgi:hypothetical protein
VQYVVGGGLSMLSYLKQMSIVPTDRFHLSMSKVELVNVVETNGLTQAFLTLPHAHGTVDELSRP